MSLYLRIDPYGALRPEEDRWREAVDGAPAERGVILPLGRFLSEGGEAVALQPTDDPYALEGRLADLDLITVAFPKFTDGRGLSIATLLRKRLKYRGELRAVGDVLADHLFAMARCGFTGFSLRADQRVDEALKAFHLFPDVYQDAADGVAPLFRRRAGASEAARLRAAV